MDVLTLTKKLISIPSYVGKDCDEQKIGQFIFEYLKQFAWLKVVKQPVKNGRFNILVTDNSPTKVILCGHLDTVQPRNGWKTKPLKPTLINNKLYGLGASDMKSGVAAILSSLTDLEETKGLMVFLYVDEEYDFLGMKQFLKEYRYKIKPELVISGDGSAMNLVNGCRGLIEINFLVKGITGHAGKPELGKNAIQISNETVKNMTQILISQYSNKELGASTCNLAYIQGGLDLRQSLKDRTSFGKEGNNIADLCEVVIDIRTADKNLNAKTVVKLLKSEVEKFGGILESFTIRHDLGCWITPKSDLNRVKDIANKTSQIDFANSGSFGYIDTQMIWQQFNKVSCFTLGAGGEGTAHKPNEYVEIKKLDQLTTIFKNLIFAYAKGGEKKHDRRI